MPNARRVTIFRDHEGQWRYRVQSSNWKTIEASEQGFARERTVQRRVEKRWPGVEIVVQR